MFYNVVARYYFNLVGGWKGDYNFETSAIDNPTVLTCEKFMNCKMY